MGAALSFFNEYLNNIEYSFKDENYDINNPIKERQILLDKFGLYDIIIKLVNFLSTVETKIQKAHNEKIQEIVNQILDFLGCFSEHNEDIKKKIFYDLKKICNLYEKYNQGEFTTLLNFIFNVLKGSESLLNEMLENEMENNEEEEINTNINNTEKKENEENQINIDYDHLYSDNNSNNSENESEVDKKKVLKLDQIFSYI